MLTPHGSAPVPVRHGDPVLDLSAAFDRWQAANPNVSTFRKNSPVAAHWLCVVSPGWVAAGGDPHDPDTNPRIRELMFAARGWAAAAGLGDVLQVRYDVDERGSALVDLVTVPTHVTPKGRCLISVNKCLERVAAAHKRHATEAFKALQDSWSDHVRAHLDQEIQRGEAKATKGKDRLTPEEYGTAKDWEREMLRRERAVQARERKLDAAGAAVAQERATLERERQAAMGQVREVMAAAVGKRGRGSSARP